MEAIKFKAYISQDNLGLALSCRTCVDCKFDTVRTIRERECSFMALLCHYADKFVGIGLGRTLDIRNFLLRDGALVSLFDEP